MASASDSQPLGRAFEKLVRLNRSNTGVAQHLGAHGPQRQLGHAAAHALREAAGCVYRAQGQQGLQPRQQALGRRGGGERESGIAAFFYFYFIMN